MKRTVLRSLVVLFCIAAAALACTKQTQKQATPQVNTQTVAPAAAQPAANGTDAMTQTVDVGDGRSEADGGVDTDPGKAAPAPGTAAPSKAKHAKTKK